MTGVLHIQNPPNDWPFEDCVRAADKLARAGCLTYQKWTCGRCGDRVTANDANVFTRQGHHEERADGSPCDFTTNIKRCNYRVDAPTLAAQEALLQHMAGTL